jgi:hypothetical protein
MLKSRACVLCAGMFGLIGIAALARGDILAGVLVFLVAIGCALRAHLERKREQT